ncbi:hypothetical protein [Romboutsia sp.]|uniref:hypothetical protein n=1 Tax=Romboutsia sp. TaxID=1965302 RepID=UPI003F36F7FD
MGNCYEGNSKNCSHSDCQAENIGNCDKYKAKSDELSEKGYCLQEEANKFICESKKLEEHARELECKANCFCNEAKEYWDKAYKIEAESNRLLDLANFYSQKASECYKNTRNSCECRSNCGSDCCTPNCSCQSKNC